LLRFICSVSEGINPKEEKKWNENKKPVTFPATGL
jgi:hypothetical protein